MPFKGICLSREKNANMTIFSDSILIGCKRPEWVQFFCVHLLC